ncbi:MAG: DNA polymerase III subunit alpha [Candidatus Neomarinimicrobiota bacterium]|nr:DNA polymerase III subunit alpha [Candidatus Neomarinimicrobiota bacterium]
MRKQRTHRLSHMNTITHLSTLSQSVDSKRSANLLIKVCNRALLEKCDPITTAVLKRLTYELDIIIDMGYADYFLIVWDIVRWANRRGIPTVGRGSAAGSMVSYLLGITPVDPLKHKLIFERFLNPERKEPPDIDVDLCWKRRDEVLEYVYERYGEERVAMISTFNTYRFRGALRDVARAMGLSEREINRLRYEERGDACPPVRRRRGQMRNGREGKSDPQYGEVFRLARQLEGRPRHMGIHCGGIVISPEKITDCVPLQRSTKGPMVTQFDMHGVEKVGLVKIDLLGQRSLTVVAEMADTLKKKYGVSFDRHTMPEMDEKTKALIREGRTMGVFQIESPGMRGLLKKLQVDTFEMITAASSVIRPGPADSGMLRHFVKRHHGKEEVETVHASLTELLEETYGVMLYQEDVIKIAEAIAGWSLDESDKLRRSMSGKRVEEPFIEHRDHFIRDAVKRGVNVEAALEIWRQMKTFSGYAFCKAHSAAYSVISVQSAWLKAHFPAEFMAAVMSNYGGFYHTSCYLEEARRLGITIRPPDANHAELHFTAEEGVPYIRIGFLQIKGLTQRTLANLLAKRKERPFESLEDFCVRVKPACREVEALIRCGAFDSFGYTRPQHLWRLKLFCERMKMSEEGLFPDAVKLSSTVPAVDYPLEKKLRDELELIEFTIEKHPLWIWKEALQRHANKVGGFTHACDLHRHVGRKVTLVGWMVTTRRTRTKLGEMMQFLSCEDLTGMYEAVLFPVADRKFGGLIRSRGPYIIEGRVEDDFGHTPVTVGKLTVLTE